jgi:hypothetical protein
MITFIFLYGGGHSVIVDGDCDIRRHRNGLVVIIHIISLGIFVFLGGQLEELDQTKAHWHHMIMMRMYMECVPMDVPGADSVNMMTLMSMMSSCQCQCQMSEYHGCAWLWMEVPYFTVATY